ncbi:uncharacterized protein LOC111077312 [Drosophila obscura]|uniref:uncharacterized protein LOC111077312 n=1 Tax=Drosophila obscura TaxID=7282 RepID=UPI000BA0326F|nr:uncharacterized protein LOC111077312 [Drosophila obscura]
MGAVLGSPSPQASLPTAQSGGASETAPREISETRPKSLSPKPSSRKRTKSKSGNMMSIDQRLPAEAIHQEFDRLLVQVQDHLTDVEERPCLEAANKMKRCLRQNSQHACRCFSAMEVYRNCVILATQDRVDDLADEGPPLMPMTPPQPMPPPSRSTSRSNRWWKFWHWFR